MATIDISMQNSIGSGTVSIVEKRAPNVIQNGGLYNIMDLLDDSLTSRKISVPAGVVLMFTYNVNTGSTRSDGCAVQFQYIANENEIYNIVFWNAPGLPPTNKILKAIDSIIPNPDPGADPQCFSKTEHIIPGGGIEIVPTQNP